MALRVADRVKETSGTTGTTDYNLAGASSAFRTFVTGVGNGHSCYYLATDGTLWELGIGTVTAGSPDVLSRDTIIANSSGTTSKLNWGAGTKTIFAVAPQEVFGAIGAQLGVATTGGTASALTLDMPIRPRAYVTNMRIAGVAHTTVSAAVTVNVTGAAGSGLGAKTLKKYVVGSKQNLAATDLVSGQYFEAYYDGTDFIVTTQLNDLSFQREKLAGARTYYVRTDGSDSNTGLTDSAGGAFLTIQKAVDTVCDKIDVGEHNVIIQVRAGTFAESVILRRWVGRGGLTLLGDGATPSNVVISASGVCLTSVAGAGAWTVSGFKLTSSGANGVTVSMSRILFGAMEFGACAAGQHILAQQGGQVVFNADCTISGGAARHWFANNGGYIECSGKTVTLSGTPAFSANFATASNAGLINCGGNTFSGSATGARFAVSSNGLISTGGGGTSYLPGDSAGSEGSPDLYT